MIEPRIDMYLGGEWVRLPNADDVHNGVRRDPPITISAGSKSEDGKPAPSRCKFTLNDRDGLWNRRNASSPYRGSLGKNTPVRVRVPIVADSTAQTVSDGWGDAGSGYVWENGFSSGGTVASTDWSRAGTQLKHAVPDNAYRRTDLTGSEDFVDSTTTFSVNVPIVNIGGAGYETRLELRSLDNNNFVWVSLMFNIDETLSLRIRDRIDGIDRRLSDQVLVPGLSTLAGQTFWVSVLAEGSMLCVKAWADGTPEPRDWFLIATRVTERAGRTALTSRTFVGNTNTKPIQFTYDGWRVDGSPFIGEVTEFSPGVGDASHAARYMHIVASGIIQRQQQGTDPLKSALYRMLSTEGFWVRLGGLTATGVGNLSSITGTDADAADVGFVGDFGYLLQGGFLKEDTIFEITQRNSSAGSTSLVFSPDALEVVEAGDVMVTYRKATLPQDRPIVYWPCEDGSNATQVASGLKGGDPLVPRVAVPRFGVDDTVAGSEALMQLNNAELFDFLPDYTNTNELTIHFIARFPDTDEGATGSDLLQFYTVAPGGNVNWEIQYAAGGGAGDLVIRASDPAGTLLFSTPYDMGMRGQTRQVLINLYQPTPSTVAYRMTTVGFQGEGATNVAGPTPIVTVPGLTTLGKINRLRVNPDGGYVNVTFGHLAIIPRWLDYFNISLQAGGNWNDWVPFRFARLADEEDVPLVYRQSTKQASSTMGVQRTDTLMRNFEAAAALDMGKLGECKGIHAFQYRPRVSLYNQEPALVIDYEGGAVLPDLTPSDDDQGTRNDVTVSRDKGSKARVVVETGPMSVLQPPDGVGRYTESPTLNASRDSHLERYAAWLTHLGTVDEFRYPSIRLTSATGVIPLHRLMSIDYGNRVIVTNAATSSARTYEPIDQLVNGWQLTLDADVPVLEINCIPASPYNVSEMDSGYRLDSDDTVTTEALDSTEVGIDISGTPWVDTVNDPAEFPFDCLVDDVERVTVTGITGVGPAQTMTVVRSVNGLVKSHAPGVAVRLADPVYLAL
jgi:hypothetical protein